MAILETIQRIKDNVSELRQNLAEKGFYIPEDARLNIIKDYVVRQTPAILSTDVLIRWWEGYSHSDCDPDSEAVLNNPLLIYYIDSTTGKLTQANLFFNNRIVISTYVHSPIFLSAIPIVFKSYNTTVADETITTPIDQETTIKTTNLYTIVADNVAFDGLCYVPYEKGGYNEYSGGASVTINITSKGVESDPSTPSDPSVTTSPIITPPIKVDPEV